MDRYGARFRQMIEEADAINQTKIPSDRFAGAHAVDDSLFAQWSVKVAHLLRTVAGENSAHVKSFEENSQENSFTTNYDIFVSCLPILVAAEDDYASGMFKTTRVLVQAEVFDTELEQATELHRSGYHAAAAVIAGTVLETTIRKICDSQQVAQGKHDKLDKLNADLVKAGVYNSLVQKRVTALAAVRNSAAHGKVDEYRAEDVASMIDDVARFIEQHLS